MHGLLHEAAPRDDEVRVTFARAARLALAGLLAPPALLGLASAIGHPLRAAADASFWLAALSGFCGAGWFAGRSLGVGRRRECALAGAFLAAGLLVAPAFRELQGLTGHESVLVVAASTLPAFGAAFTLAGTLAARVLRISFAGPRAILVCAAGGLLGGAFAMLPFWWACLRLDPPGESLVVLTLAVVGFLGCLIAPFSIAGRALERARTQRALARGHPSGLRFEADPPDGGAQDG
jgi:hypothetical protein